MTAPRDDTDYDVTDFERVAQSLRRRPADRPPPVSSAQIDAWVEWGRHPWWWQLCHRAPRWET